MQSQHVFLIKSLKLLIFYNRINVIPYYVLFCSNNTEICYVRCYRCKQYIIYCNFCSVIARCYKLVHSLFNSPARMKPLFKYAFVILIIYFPYLFLIFHIKATPTVAAIIPAIAGRVIGFKLPTFTVPSGANGTETLNDAKLVKSFEPIFVIT
jgi:hypothetical protein